MGGPRRVAVAVVLAAFVALPACGLILGSEREAAKARVELAPKPELPNVDNPLSGGVQTKKKTGKSTTTTSTPKRTTTTTTLVFGRQDGGRGTDSGRKGNSGSGSDSGSDSGSGSGSGSDSGGGSSQVPSGGGNRPGPTLAPSGVVAPPQPGWVGSAVCQVAADFFNAGTAWWGAPQSTSAERRSELFAALVVAWNAFEPFATDELRAVMADLLPRQDDIVNGTGDRAALAATLSRGMKVALPLIRRVNLDCYLAAEGPQPPGGPADPVATDDLQRLIIDELFGGG